MSSSITSLSLHRQPTENTEESDFKRSPPSSLDINAPSIIIPSESPPVAKLLQETHEIHSSFRERVIGKISTTLFNYFVKPHVMTNHVFKPASCVGGELYYDGDVPVLSLEMSHPYSAGFAHGYLCGSAIEKLSSRFATVLHTLSGQPRANELKKTIKEIIKKIPKNYLDEMKGLLDGYNSWSKTTWWFTKKISLEDLVLFHLLPDSIHFDPSEYEHGVKSEAEKYAVACTSILSRETGGEIVFARNMDWPSMGLAGSYSLVINRKNSGDLHSTIEVGVPGMIGTLTGMNDKGLSLAMNVCAGDTTEIEGMPAVFYNRVCLESCSTVKDVEKVSKTMTPLGSYHLTVADTRGGQSIHFKQSEDRTNVIRRLKSKNNFMATLNYCYSPKPEVDMHCSEDRYKEIKAFFKKRGSRSIEDVLALPYVNNELTTHRVIMKPGAKIMQVAFDNLFAGKSPLHTLSTTKLFGK